MKPRHTLTFAAAVAAAAAVSVPAAFAQTASAQRPALRSGPRVSLRVEGLHRTLQRDETVLTRTGTFTRAGHRTSNSTALGLLNTATAGHWRGQWSTKYREWSVTSILNESHPFSSKYYWALYVNGTQASVGASEFKLKAGQRVVFAAIPDADYDEQLLNITTKGRETVGRTITVGASAYNARGRAVGLKGATLSYAGRSVKLKGSTTRVKLTRAGKLTLKLSKSGFVRDEDTITVRK